MSDFTPDPERIAAWQRFGFWAGQAHAVIAWADIEVYTSAIPDGAEEAFDLGYSGSDPDAATFTAERLAWLEDQVSKGYLTCLPEFKAALEDRGRQRVLAVVNREYALHRGWGQDAYERGNRDACEAILRACAAAVLNCERPLVNLTDLPDWMLGQMLWTWQDRQQLQKRDTDIRSFLAEMRFAEMATMWAIAPIIKQLRAALAAPQPDDAGSTEAGA